MRFDKDNPLDRIAGESRRAASALLDYYLMGVDRSLPNLANVYLSSTEDTPTTKINTLKAWSSRFNWQDRVDAQEKVDAAIEIKLNQDKRKQQGNNEVDDAALLRQTAHSILRAVAVVAQDGDEVVVLNSIQAIAEARRMLMDSSELARRGLGMPKETNDIDVKTDGKPIKMIFGVVEPDND